MDLLEVTLPELRLRIDESASVFFDRCEALASERGWRVDRRRQYAGPGFDQLNLYLGDDQRGYPMLRMHIGPSDDQRLHLDVVAEWSRVELEYDEYVRVARAAYAQLFSEYERAHGRRYRLRVPRKPVTVALSTLDCGKIRYAAEKFGGLGRALAVGEGDARDRLVNAFFTFHVIRPEDLPDPLSRHLAWVYTQITKRPARHRFEGIVEGTVRTMRNKTAARVIERLVDLADAIERLAERCHQKDANGG